MMTMPSYIIDAVAVYTWRGWGIIDAGTGFVAALVVDILDVEGVDVAGEVAQDC